MLLLTLQLQTMTEKCSNLHALHAVLDLYQAMVYDKGLLMCYVHGSAV